MNGLVSIPAAPASPPASTVDLGDFWPAIDINGLRAAVRLGDSILPHERLLAEIEGSAALLLMQLTQWKDRQIANGATSLADVDPIIINGRSIGEVLFETAMRYQVAAAIADGNADITATDEGVSRGAEKRTTADDYRRMATSRLRHLMALGVQDEAEPAFTGGVMVDLI